MKFIVILLIEIFAFTYASPVGPSLLPKVNLAPTQVTILRQPITVQETVPIPRTVPIPTKAVAYSAPAVLPTYAAVDWEPGLHGLPYAPLLAH